MYKNNGSRIYAVLLSLRYFDIQRNQIKSVCMLISKLQIYFQQVTTLYKILIRIESIWTIIFVCFMIVREHISTISKKDT